MLSETELRMKYWKFSRMMRQTGLQFSDLSPLYDHLEKADTLEQLILELEHSITTIGGYPGRADKEPPSTLMWILFYLAQHYDLLGQYEIALRKIDEAIEHSPTIIDLYSVKVQLLRTMLQWEEQLRSKDGLQQFTLGKSVSHGEVAIVSWPHGDIMKFIGSTAVDAARRIRFEGKLVSVNGLSAILVD